MATVTPKINLASDRVIFAGINMKACICYDGDGASSDQMCPRTGEKSNLFIAEHATGSIGSRLSFRAFELTYYQAQELLSCLANSIGASVESSIFTEEEDRDFALHPIFTFRSRDLNIGQLSNLVHRHGEL